ncbi:MAG: hypothetical protein H6748_19265 [Spirochaetaceae bacterium]|nr:hypothetical protein [Myxococcales bacterium]MCB9726196.1 hypothetical protein [Spirochaetaceae bacterium]HPG25134.1 hypothetical protein [Myxococcota bacterium]
MLLAQNRHWRVTRGKGSKEIVIGLEKEELPEDWRDFRDFRLEIPVDRWNRIVKHVRTDRKLFGGVVLEFVNQEDQLPIVLGQDRLYGDLQRVVQDATSTLVESGTLALAVVDIGAE